MMASVREQLARSCAIGLVSLVLVLGSGCFSPEIPDGLACGADGVCPGAQICGSAGVCVQFDEARDDLPSIGPDAGQTDAAIEALEPDAAIPADPTVQTLGFEYTGVITNFVVPAGVTLVTLEAFGAEGGAGNGPEVGGKGARMKGDIDVQPGDVLRILVGERGKDAVLLPLEFEQGGGSGGGGSFVVSGSGAALMIAGGGGGASYRPTLLNGGDGQTTEAAQAGGGGAEGGAGGDPGLGGSTNSNSGGFHVGTGGGGFATGGVGLSDGNAGSYGTPNAPGSSFIDGGAGGIAGTKGRNGGFGGGGSAGFCGGGGGGFAGGGAGDHTAADHGGGGGSSYNAGVNQDNSAGVRTGNGLVLISWKE